MNECKIQNLSGWKPAANNTFKPGTGDSRGIIMNNHAIEAGPAMKIRIAPQNIL
jgi:hypothetical protein